jgi:galactonate dehydratase
MDGVQRRHFLLNSGIAAGIGIPAAAQSAVRGVKPLKVTGCRIYIAAIDGRYPVLAQLLTDQGVTGVGDAAVAYGTGAASAAAMVQDLVRQFVLGRDPFAIEAIWSGMYDHSFWARGGGTIVFAGISAIEQALWDIKGKCLGVPVFELLGGKMRDKVRVYANGWSFRCTQPSDFAREAERVVKDGYKALKVYPLATAELDAEGHIRHVSLRSIDSAAERKALAIVKAVRDAIGPDVELMLDMSAELTTDAIIRLGRKCEEWNIAFFEEPVDPTNVEALKKVSEHVNIPLAVGERVYTRYGFRRIMELHAADILQPDIGNTGGIMETKKIAAMAETYSMRIQPHNCSSPVCTAASLQIDANIANFYIQELYPYRKPEHFAVVDRAPELDVKDGYMPVSGRPGLGVELVEARVKPYLWGAI